VQVRVEELPQLFFAAPGPPGDFGDDLRHGRWEDHAAGIEDRYSICATRARVGRRCSSGGSLGARGLGDSTGDDDTAAQCLSRWRQTSAERRAVRRRQIRRRRQACCSRSPGCWDRIDRLGRRGRGSSAGRPRRMLIGPRPGRRPPGRRPPDHDTGTTSTGATIAASGGPAHVRAMVAYPRTVPPWTNPSPWTGQHRRCC